MPFSVRMELYGNYMTSLFGQPGVIVPTHELITCVKTTSRLLFSSKAKKSN